ncbi:response regulator transcription factor [Jiangella aurantiaca]|uniref:Response regulator transcription factor n=2 Tax=Jiangella aurantiaca TaxID=2530373 RepID=A0A4R5AHD8_9ACTN|nr:response regulator transcription factor [Jiangella aurantiaca]
MAELDQGNSVLATARRTRAQVLVLDVMLRDPVDVHDLCRQLPGLRVLMLLERGTVDGTCLSLARMAPRVGLIATDASLADLLDAVRRVARGEPVLDPALAVAALTAAESPLTHRELDVLRLAMTGAPPQEIARTLYLSPGTVRNYLSHILTKTGARTRIEAIRIAQDAGWI